MAEKQKKKNKQASATSGQTLAVKYRPRVLTDLVGQESVAVQVEGMVKKGRFPSTIGLFGESGAGKTTMARMIARYVNCASPSGADGTPCGECASCSYKNNHPDVHEINMADNRGIDDVRTLISSARSMPTVGKRRVFILDELHACFTGNTKVILADGSAVSMLEIQRRVDAGKSISVLSYNKESETIEAKAVTHFQPKTAAVSDMRKVVIRQLGVEGYIESTHDHKYWDASGKTYVKADKLKSTRLLTNTGLKSNVDRVEKWEHPPTHSEEEPLAILDVFDLTVEDNHNYFVLPVGGVSGVLVSNCTPQAFQALLKPLEEPPAHTMWIAATTNPEKLPGTILGRCHKFSIRPISEETITKRLRVISKREGVDFKEIKGGIEVLRAIAGMSNGRMRDAIQSLESVLFAIGSGKEYSSKDLIANFATSSEADLDRAAAATLVAILKGDAKTTITCIIDAGNVRGLINKLRWLVQSLVNQSVQRPFFKTYAWHTFGKMLSSNKDVKVRLSLLLEIQNMLCTTEMQLNSVSIDETVQLTSRVGQFLSDHKQ